MRSEQELLTSFTDETIQRGRPWWYAILASKLHSKYLVRSSWWCREKRVNRKVHAGSFC